MWIYGNGIRCGRLFVWSSPYSPFLDDLVCLLIQHVLFSMFAIIVSTDIFFVGVFIWRVLRVVVAVGAADTSW